MEKHSQSWSTGIGMRRGKENALSRMGRFWIPSWPMRAARPKREKPTTFARRDIAAGVGIGHRCVVVALHTPSSVGFRTVTPDFGG